MNPFSHDEMEMLTQDGWSGDFIENIEEGDQIVIKRGFTIPSDKEPSMKFVTVTSLKRIPRYERAGDWGLGPIINADHPNYLMQFIGVHDGGMREPMSYGAGWGIFRKAAQKAVF